MRASFVNRKEDVTKSVCLCRLLAADPLYDVAAELFALQAFVGKMR